MIVSDLFEWIREIAAVENPHFFGLLMNKWEERQLLGIGSELMR